MRAPLPATTILILLCLAATACKGPTLSASDLSASPAPQGKRPAAELRAMLLQLADLPSLTSRRESGSADLTTQPTPQLTLCTKDAPVGAHELASVLAKPDAPGQVQVFELLSAFANAAAARQAFDLAASAADRCASYSVSGVPYRVVDVTHPVVAGAQAVLQYRLTTPSVISGDVRTLAVSGSTLLLVTGYGAPPQGEDLLQYQAAVMGKALRRARG